MLLAALLVAIPTSSIACSCVSANDLTRNERAQRLQEFSVIVRGQVISTASPLRCTNTILRWLYSTQDATADVIHRVQVGTRMKGVVADVIEVVQRQAVEQAGCFAFGPSACEQDFSERDDLWILKRIGSNRFERATLCVDETIRELAQLPRSNYRR